MVFAVSHVIVLIGLLQFSTSAVGEAVNQKTLMNIVKNFENKLGSVRQYAVAFRVKKDECLKGSGFPSEDLLTKVKEKLLLNQVYKSNNLIAAKAGEVEHSEFRLENDLKDIVGKENECVVYFTVNSPCLKTCLSKSGKYSVKGSLELLEKYVGIKAFAFKIIWRPDKRVELINRLKEIAPKLPYYQCEKNKAQCDVL